MTVSRTLYVIVALSGLLTGHVGAAPVNINVADAATLSRELKGIGDSKAVAIIDYRQKHGAFKTVDDLALVKGVGQKLVDRNRADLRISGATSAVPVGAPAKAAAQPARPAAAANVRR